MKFLLRLLLAAALAVPASAQKLSDLTIETTATTSDRFSFLDVSASEVKTITLGNLSLVLAPTWANIASKPTTLSGFGITDAQPLDADLTAIAALSTTTFGRSLLTQADAAAARTTLGVSGGSGTVTSVSLTVPSGLTVTGSPLTTSGTLAISTSLSGVLKGTGSGLAAATAGTDFLAPSGTAAIAITGGTGARVLLTASTTADTFFGVKEPGGSYRLTVGYDAARDGGFIGNDNAQQLRIGAGANPAIAFLSTGITSFAGSVAIGGNTALTTASTIATSKGGVPSGGSSGQVLTKASGTAYDVAWATPSGGGASYVDAHTGYVRVVADGGSDAGDGSPGAPFATLQAAFDAGFRAFDLGVGSFAGATINASIAIRGRGHEQTFIGGITVTGAATIRDLGFGSFNVGEVDISSGLSATLSGIEGGVVQIGALSTVTVDGGRWVEFDAQGANGTDGVNGDPSTAGTPGGAGATLSLIGNVVVSGDVNVYGGNGGAGSLPGSSGDGGAGGNGGTLYLERAKVGGNIRLGPGLGTDGGSDGVGGTANARFSITVSLPDYWGMSAYTLIGNIFGLGTGSEYFSQSAY